MQYSDAVQRLNTHCYAWRPAIEAAESLDYETLKYHTKKGGLFTPHTVAVLTALIEQRIAELDELLEAIPALGAQQSANPKVRYAGRIVMSAENLAKWREGWPGWENKLAELGYTFDGENWSKPKL